jgi:radical SAM protein with 4Fe4S-binding SPASM domain
MSNFYCAAPWRGLHINPRGDVKTCCAGDPNMLGNLDTQTIDDIINGNKLKEIRQALKKGETHPYCYNCIERENVGGDSERSWHNNTNEDFDITQATLEYEYPTIVDVRWNTTCNLSCNYCDANASSKWAAILGAPYVVETRHYYEDVCNFILKDSHGIKQVALVGGEPLLLKENIKLLDVVPKECEIVVITNLSTNLENNELFKKLAQRTNVGWSVSFDNIGSRFEYVRYGADWKVIQRNLDIIQSLPGHRVGIHAVYGLYNATRLCEFKSFAEQRNLRITWQNLYVPDALDPRRYGSEIATLASAEIKRFFEEYNATEQERSLFAAALEHYESQTQPNLIALEQLKTFINNTETKYHPDSQGQFQSLWPELGAVLWP